MNITKLKIKTVKDSRGEKTIQVIVNGCKTSAPSGKSTGNFEKKPYKKSLNSDIKFLEKFDKFPEVDSFEDLIKVERKVKNKIGANSLFALEASILKALAKEQRKDLWELLNSHAKKTPKVLSNIIGGGAHSEGKKPDFQEFLVCSKNYKINKQVWRFVFSLLKKQEKKLKLNDEKAWATSLDNEKVLDVLLEAKKFFAKKKKIKLDFGLDVAASQFYKKGKYYYKNKKEIRDSKKQIHYIDSLVKRYNLFYVEDGLDENDFSGFAKLKKKLHGDKCLDVGDDLTVTNLGRVKKAFAKKSIDAVIIKPNQIGSLIEAKKVIDFCKQKKIKTIISHRSGETNDDTIADLGVAWECDYIKTPVVGRERFAKIKRLEKISRKL